MRIFAVLAIFAATLSPALGQEPAPMNKFAEACSLWTANAEPAGSYIVTNWVQRHRTIYMWFDETGEDHTVQCIFRDLKDEVPELETLVDGEDRQEGLLIRNFNHRIWLHFVPDPTP